MELLMLARLWMALSSRFPNLNDVRHTVPSARTSHDVFLAYAGLGAGKNVNAIAKWSPEALSAVSATSRLCPLATM